MPNDDIQGKCHTHWKFIINTLVQELANALKSLGSNANFNEELFMKLDAFVESNEVVATSENYRNPQADDLNILTQVQQQTFDLRRLAQDISWP